MKTYATFIYEMSLFSKNSREMDKKFDEITSKYPGVQEFLMAAKEWAHEIDKDYDPALYKLLDSLKRKKSIKNLSDTDLRKIYKFIVKRRLSDYDDMVNVFIQASPDTGTTKWEIEY
jgi:hypothetical protein